MNRIIESLLNNRTISMTLYDIYSYNNVNLFFFHKMDNENTCIGYFRCNWPYLKFGFS